MILKDTSEDKHVLGLLHVSLPTANQLSTALALNFKLKRIHLDDEYRSSILESKAKLVLIELSEATLKEIDQYRAVVSWCRDHDIPVIAILSANDVTQMAYVFYMGISDYLVYPIVPMEAIARISSQINLAASRKAINYIVDKSSSTPRPTDQDDPGINRSLIVDDSDEVTSALSQLLSDSFKVDTANTGIDAINLIEEEHYDLVLLDIVMPDLSGYEVCEILKSNEKTKEIPIVFLTAQSKTNHEVKGLSMGAVDYIHKPVSLDMLKARVSKHLADAKKISHLDELSHTDPLTGLPNRRRFESVFSSEFHRAQRMVANLTVAMIDIDQFKLYNDAFGHDKGDDCLKQVADALQQAAKRAGDIICRVGGEEFAAILPNTDLAGGVIYARKLIDSVAELGIEHSPVASNDIVTLSVGVASCNAGHVENMNELMFRADQMLYKAKSKGRHRVESVELEANETQHVNCH